MSEHDITRAEHIEYVLRLADNVLILGQRISEWCGHAPVIEEDLALSNMALDLIGQSRLLLTHAGELEGKGRDEDQLAFLRVERDFRNVTLMEVPNEDFGRTTVRNFLFSAFQVLLWDKLSASTDRALAAIAAKSLKEARYHLNHSAEWVIRLGDGTALSQQKTQAALDYLWPYSAELFADSPVDAAAAAAGIGPAWSALEAEWEALVLPVLAEATLVVPARTPFKSFGKFGRHSEHMGHLLATMQYMQRTYPGAQW
ncbi:1,2-phenylacetyl-CoA epoxidase subunit PaaC [Parazoarcus communis]|uniref:Phenylacetate-CoA oxygenase subunit PaaI n=1 Tax=Parazoarcus communis SWub3 = DSM 12120 TaxID=1121029 RepID=A0A323V7V0_9RHOO|nr:1,2-phenylacetyl-CoA epoxidase subunit PaaC [Parazoarcus communis]NMG70858.1 phenylacetate-CoA oxygenase subunit PaaC [Parazoarcus communis SWub3 = DSM 12120]PZA16248.1 phenylacetate-CoA oxygenase subunit PaaI [Azoarcus communis] [Parazoarcus communis SWub3 = DSM 12120]